MTGRVLSGFAIATLLGATGFVSPVAKLDAAPNQPSTRVETTDTRAMARDESGMVALQRHAQIDMILYTGDLGSSELASARVPLRAVALTVPAGTK